MRLFYRVKGQGEPLIILHGLYGSSDNWLSIANMLSPSFTIYMPDLRNHGQSPHAGTHSYDDLKNDLLAFMDVNNITKATLLGHSMGGKLAMYFAACCPGRVTKLIVADIAPKNYLLINDKSQYNLHRDILLAMQEIDFSTVKDRRQVNVFLSQIIEEQRVRQFLLKNITKDKTSGLLKWKVNAKVLYNYLDEIVGGVDKMWLINSIPITSYPVIFIKGGDSGYIQEEDERLINEIYPETEIITIPGAGHWLHAEQPDLFIEAVRY